MSRYRSCFMIALLSLSSYLWANEYEYNGQCKGYKNNFEDCLDKELAKYDKELNDIYKSFLKDGPHKELIKVEQLWVKYKEADCSYMAKEVHGSLYYQFVYNACLINKTKTRIAELKRSYFYAGWFEKKN